MKTLSSIIVAGVSAVAMLAAAPVSAQDNPPVAGEKRMLPHNNLNTPPVNPPGPAGHRNEPAAGTGDVGTGADASGSAGDVPPTPGAVAGEKRMLPHNNLNTPPINPPGPAGHRNQPAAGTGPGSTGAVGTGVVGSNEAVGAIGSDWVPTTDPVAAEDLIGADVVSYQNWMIGEVESTTVVDGRTAYLVAVDEELGMGSRVISIHEDHTSVFRNRENLNEFRIAVDATREAIRNQPEYIRDGSLLDNPNDTMQTR